MVPVVAEEPTAAAPAPDRGGPATTYRPTRRAPLRHRLRRKLARLVTRYRSSLSLRMLTATLLGGAVALTVLGGVIALQIRDGLYDRRVEQVLQDAALRTQDAQRTFDAATATTAQQVQSVANDWIDALESSSSGAVGTLLMRSPGSASAVRIAEPATIAAPRSVVTAEMRAAVVAPGEQYWQPVRLPGSGDPGIVVGSVVTLPAAGEYELYTVYTLGPEEETIFVVLRVLAVGAGALVLVLAGMVWAITRWVLRPVQQAAFAAERLADGMLDERMEVRGHDELAVLGESFNEMAASLQRQIERMEELSRLQQRFVSDVSHELRTPLTTIRIAGELIHDARASFDPAVRRSAELLHDQLDRFEAMLADLLEISRFDAGAAVLDVEERDVVDLVDRVVEGAVLLADRRGSTVRVHAPGPCPADVDPRRVERILRNLLVNAIEHGEGQPIDITVAASDSAVAVQVRDHGVGMSPEAAEHVFDRFWRADPARARTTGGTGLGLAISAEDARLHGGRLEAWGQVGLGAVFRLTLPRRAGVEAGPSPLPLAPGPVTAAPHLLTGPARPTDWSALAGEER